MQSAVVLANSVRMMLIGEHWCSTLLAICLVSVCVCMHLPVGMFDLIAPRIPPTLLGAKFFVSSWCLVCGLCVLSFALWAFDV